MRFVVLKSGFDGISGGSSRFDSIDKALREISHHKGWDSREQLHAAIRHWAENAKPGGTFCTQVSAIVAVALDGIDRDDETCDECGHDDLEYGEFEPVESGDVEQAGECPKCGHRWRDVFTLTERRTLCKAD